ncbi:hypothetical protein WA158_001010 [Blastocystis sp. Blastoise]
MSIQFNEEHLEFLDSLSKPVTMYQLREDTIENKKIICPEFLETCLQILEKEVTSDEISGPDYKNGKPGIYTYKMNGLIVDNPHNYNLYAVQWNAACVFHDYKAESLRELLTKEIIRRLFGIFYLDFQSNKVYDNASKSLDGCLVANRSLVTDELYDNAKLMNALVNNIHRLGVLDLLKNFIYSCFDQDCDMFFYKDFNAFIDALYNNMFYDLSKYTELPTNFEDIILKSRNSSYLLLSIVRYSVIKYSGKETETNLPFDSITHSIISEHYLSQYNQVVLSDIKILKEFEYIPKAKQEYKEKIQEYLHSINSQYYQWDPVFISPLSLITKDTTESGYDIMCIPSLEEEYNDDIDMNNEYIDENIDKNLGLQDFNKNNNSENNNNNQDNNQIITSKDIYSSLSKDYVSQQYECLKKDLSALYSTMSDKIIESCIMTMDMYICKTPKNIDNKMDIIDLKNKNNEHKENIKELRYFIEQLLSVLMEYLSWLPSLFDDWNDHIFCSDYYCLGDSLPATFFKYVPPIEKPGCIPKEILFPLLSDSIQLEVLIKELISIDMGTIRLHGVESNNVKPRVTQSVTYLFRFMNMLINYPDLCVDIQKEQIESLLSVTLLLLDYCKSHATNTYIHIQLKSILATMNRVIQTLPESYEIDVNIIFNAVVQTIHDIDDSYIRFESIGDIHKDPQFQYITSTSSDSSIYYTAQITSSTYPFKNIPLRYCLYNFIDALSPSTINTKEEFEKNNGPGANNYFGYTITDTVVKEKPVIDIMKNKDTLLENKDIQHIKHLANEMNEYIVTNSDIKKPIITNFLNNTDQIDFSSFATVKQNPWDKAKKQKNQMTESSSSLLYKSLSKTLSEPSTQDNNNNIPNNIPELYSYESRNFSSNIVLSPIPFLASPTSSSPSSPLCPAPSSFSIPRTSSSGQEPADLPTMLPQMSSMIPEIPSMLPHIPSNIPQIPSTIHEPPSMLPEVPSMLPQIPSTIHEPPSMLPHIPSNIPKIPSTIHEPPSILPQIPSNIPKIPSTIHEPPSILPQIPSMLPEIPSTIPKIPSTIHYPSFNNTDNNNVNSPSFKNFVSSLNHVNVFRDYSTNNIPVAHPEKSTLPTIIKSSKRPSINQDSVYNSGKRVSSDLTLSDKSYKDLNTSSTPFSKEFDFSSLNNNSNSESNKYNNTAKKFYTYKNNTNESNNDIDPKKTMRGTQSHAYN